MAAEWMPALVAFPLALVLTWVFRSIARRLSLIDVPNERSSHTVPTPRGGGLAFVVVTLAVYLYFRAPGYTGWDAVLCFAMAVAVVAALDDLLHLPAFVRIGAYSLGVAALLWALVAPSRAVELAPFGVAINFLMMFVAVLWHTNLLNFMDGIDGLAACQAILVCLAAAGLMSAGSHADQAWVPLIIAATVAGFLVFNWAPASVFMGDTGSVFLGFLLAGMAVLTVAEKTLLLGTWLILLALFIVDASYTLIRRIVAGVNVFSAHREHLYQRLSTRWQSHSRVVCVYMLVNLLWLIPLAYTTQAGYLRALYAVPIAYLPLLACMAKLRRLT